MIIVPPSTPLAGPPPFRSTCTAATLSAETVGIVQYLPTSGGGALTIIPGLPRPPHLHACGHETPSMPIVPAAAKTTIAAVSSPLTPTPAVAAAFKAALLSTTAVKMSTARRRNHRLGHNRNGFA